MALSSLDLIWGFLVSDAAGWSAWLRCLWWQILPPGWEDAGSLDTGSKEGHGTDIHELSRATAQQAGLAPLPPCPFSFSSKSTFTSEALKIFNQGRHKAKTALKRRLSSPLITSPVQFLLSRVGEPGLRQQGSISLWASSEWEGSEAFPCCPPWARRASCALHGGENILFCGRFCSAFLETGNYRTKLNPTGFSVMFFWLVLPPAVVEPVEFSPIEDQLSLCPPMPPPLNAHLLKYHSCTCWRLERSSKYHKAQHKAREVDKQYFGHLQQHPGFCHCTSMLSLPDEMPMSLLCPV